MLTVGESRVGRERSRTRRVVSALLVLGVLGASTVPAPARADPSDSAWEGYPWLRDLMRGSERERRRAAKKITRTHDPRFVAPLVDSLFFVRREDREPMVDVLRELTDVDRGRDYYAWVEWVGARKELPTPPAYLGWKRSLLSRIDPQYQTILRSGSAIRIRPEEIVWGGVRVEGIPALDRPPLVAAGESGLAPDTHVFGVEVGGEARAYPVPVLSWHEMANDVVGGRAVTLSFCTLCGSAVLFDGESVDDGPRTFGTSGLLYRSNKLMVDRQTSSLWSNLTGEAVLGPAAEAPDRLRLLPLVRTRWDEWVRRHPDTTVLDVATLARRYAFDYRPGAADRAREGVSFPVWQTSDALPERSEVFVLRLPSRAKVYPLQRLPTHGVLEDRVGDTPVVLVTDGGGGVRAYRGDGRRFTRGEGGLVDSEGCHWTVTEPALVPCSASEDRTDLPRIPGHLAFWFGWYGTVPDAEVYSAPAGGP